MTTEFREKLNYKIRKIKLRTKLLEIDFKGCTKEEIQQVMEAQKVNRLPKVYIEFLEFAGKQGRLHLNDEVWTFYHHKWIFTMKEFLKKMLELHKSVDWELEEDAFVFIRSDRGIDYLYFLTENDEDDPPVYFFSEEEFMHGIFAEKLSDALLEI